MAQRLPQADGVEISQAPPNRSPSFSSDVMSSSAKSTTTAQYLPNANPPPAYIARSEASDLVSAEQDRTVDVSQPALILLNEFLDHVLFCLITASHSVALGQLRAAVPAVLKPRLGKAALRSAEDELKEYMEDEEAEELYANTNFIQPRSQFDPDLVWKLTRLRCMVYARMGDLEEEDEAEWLEKEHLLEQAASFPAEARQVMAITPAAAIFLTAVLEFLGEQALYYAAQYAQKRHDNARNQSLTGRTPESELAVRHSDIVLDGKDMNHVGRDSPLSRLWRSWRRNTRSPVDSHSRPTSPDTMLSPTSDSIHSRTTSSSLHQPIQPILEEKRLSNENILRAATPSQIPLPISDNDVAEIEGYEFVTSENASRRPMSMPVIPASYSSEAAAGVYDQNAPTFQERSPLRPSFARFRSTSLPSTRVSFDLPSPAGNESEVSPIEPQNNNELKTVSEQNAVGENDSKNELAFNETTETTIIPDSVAEGQVAARTTQKASPSSEQLNTTVGTLAGALGAVGVHHVVQDIQPSQINAAESLARRQPNPMEPALTSASIRGPGDFDMMYVPDGRLSPPDEEPVAPVVDAAASESESKANDPYHQIRMRQYEEHKRYSQQSHEMDTPSIYSHREHSPRFPKDMRPTSSQASDSGKRTSTHVSASEPDGTFFRQEQRASLPSGAIAGIAPQLASKLSPASPDGSRRFSRQSATQSVESDIVQDLPPSKAINQSTVDERTAGHARGHSKSSSSSSRLLGFTRDASGRPQTIHQQNAAGNMTDETRKAHSSTPNSMNKSRPDTANDVSPPKRQHLRIRADSDNNAVKVFSNGEAAKRSLEEMLNSDETLHYTLTPATANFRDDVMKPQLVLTQMQDHPDVPKSTGLSQENATPKSTTRSRKASMEASRAPQIVTRSRKVSMEAGRAPQVVSSHGDRKLIPSSRDIPQQPASPTRTRNPIGVPRDAKIDRMSGVRDLADYMRSTGPTNEDQLPRALSVRPTSPTTIRTAVPTSPVRNQPPSPQSVRRPKNRLQARDPRPSRHAESSALINFIREGPPPQPGLPHRNTTDSDEMNGLDSSVPKASSDMTGVPSIATTNNSHTPLVSNQARMGASPPSYARVDPDASNGLPRKTRTRVRDPYSLDDSDDDLMNESTRKTTTEESLIDFLRNTAPPQSMTAQPILEAPIPQRKESLLNRKPSIDKLKTFGRNKSSTAGPTASVKAQALAQPRAESPHLTQAGSKLDSYRPTQATHAAHVDRNRANKIRNDSRTASMLSQTRPQSPKAYGDTADLAEYLRNTGPPPGSEDVQPFILTKTPVNGVRQQPESGGGGGLKKFFSIRGKK